MFIGPCIIAIVDEWKTNLMSLAILFRLLCAQHVSGINISIFRSLRLCCWITTSVVLFSVRCVLELLVRLVLGGVRFAGFSLQNEHHCVHYVSRLVYYICCFLAVDVKEPKTACIYIYLEADGVTVCNRYVRFCLATAVIKMTRILF